MEVLELALIVLACVIGSAVLCQVVPRLSLPLVQIAVGAVVALAVPAVRDVSISSELFLVLFIAPLLFNEARETNPRDLWENKGSILSLAVGLVLLTVLVVGFVLNWFVPSIPLAVAFACAAALAPTDAAAVGALASSVSLKRRQSTLLSGESLINDASGVVAFQFASAAALTGAFSALDAAEEFGRLFLGGIAAGVVVGVVGLYSMRALRRGGYESTTINVLYEVFSPFFVYLFAEWLGTSGILAVVAAGLIMADRSQRLTSASWCPAASGASSCSSSTRWCSFFWVFSCPRPSRRPLPTTSRCRFFWGWWPWSRHLSWGAASGGCSSWRRSIASAVVAAGAARCGRRRRRWKRWRRTSLRPRRTCAIAAPIGASASAAC